MLHKEGFPIQNYTRIAKTTAGKEKSAWSGNEETFTSHFTS